MNTREDVYGAQKMGSGMLTYGILLLLIHFYFNCYSAFAEWGWTGAIPYRLMHVYINLGLISGPWKIKLVSLMFLGISILSANYQEHSHVGYVRGLILTGTGLLIYFGCNWLYDNQHGGTNNACLYMIVCFTGWILTSTGGSRLFRAVSQSMRLGFSKKEEGGFRQEERLIRTDCSINLKGKYVLNGKTRKSRINIINPRRGVLVIGSPGSGKSWFIVEPVMEQMIARGFSMLVFDYKYPTLTRLAYNLFCKHIKKYPASARYCIINFSDLSRSHRCNVISPETLGNLSDAIGVSKAIMLSVNKTWAHRQGDFFIESPINFLAALIWYLKKYKNGVYCTLPHAIELAQTPYEKLFPILNVEREVETLVNPFIQAYRNKTFEMLDGQVSSMKIPVGRLASPDLYYVLTGNDLSLEINNPAHPAVLCLGGDPARQDALGPVLSLYIDRLNKLINKPGGYPCALVLDEFATVRVTSILQTMAVGRSHNIIPFLVVQDLSQLKILYSQAEADTILNMTGNLMCGQAGGETARWISERFPGVVQHRTTVSVNSLDTSVSKSEQSNPAISPATLATLSSGEFVGILADDPGRKLDLKTFHAEIVKEPMDVTNEELPVIRKIGPGEVDENFLRIKREVAELVEEEMLRIMKDPVLRGRLGK